MSSEPALYYDNRMKVKRLKLNLVKKCFYFILGSVALTFGIIGVFLPVLPTTPFLLLAAFCYLRCSKRMYDWLIHHKIFGRYIYCYLTYKAIPKKTKITAIIFLWSSLIISMILIASLHIRIFLMVVGIGVSVHLMMLKTLSLEEMNEMNELNNSDCEKSQE